MPLTPNRPCKIRHCSELTRHRSILCDRHQGTAVIVCGPPGAGKSTWVLEQAVTGDLILDLDEMKRSICGEHRSDFPDSLLDHAIQARDFVARSWAITRDCNLWYVTTMPEPEKRAGISAELGGAKVIVFEVPADTCKQQLQGSEDIDRRSRLAVDWWEKYLPRFEDEVMCP